MDDTIYWLWAVPWMNKATANAGVTFHRSATEAKSYKVREQVPGSGVPKERPRLTPVSECLYNWVLEHGDLWAPLNSCREARYYKMSLM